MVDYALSSGKPNLTSSGKYVATNTSVIIGNSVFNITNSDVRTIGHNELLPH